MGLLVGIVEVAVCLAVFFVVGKIGWPGQNDDCLDTTPNGCYCETFRTGKMVLQPVNTWTNVGYMVVGLIVLAQLQSGTTPNPMATSSFYSIGLGMLIVFLGPASMFFHASMKAWGGWIDNMSMNLFITWVAIYDLTRMFHAGVAFFLVVWLIVNGLIGAFLIVNLRRGWGKWVFGGLIVVFVLTSVLVAVGLGGVHRQFPWLVASLVTFVVAFVIQQLSQTNRRLCFPDSWFQGHGVWHLLTALATGGIYLYLRTES